MDETTDQMILFVAGSDDPKNAEVLERVHRLRDDHFPEHSIEVIDITTDVATAERYKVEVAPTLILEAGKPHRIVGDLHDLDMVLGMLGVSGITQTPES